MHTSSIIALLLHILINKIYISMPTIYNFAQIAGLIRHSIEIEVFTSDSNVILSVVINSLLILCKFNVPGNSLVQFSTTG